MVWHRHSCLCLLGRRERSGTFVRSERYERPLKMQRSEFRQRNLSGAGILGNA